MNIRISLIIFAVLFIQSICYAQVSLPKVFGNHMVLQRGIQIPVWGNATSGAEIVAELGTESITTKADQDGNWKVRFPVFKAGGPYVLKIYESGKLEESIEFKDIR